MVKGNKIIISPERGTIIRKVVRTSQHLCIEGEEQIMLAQQILRNQYNFLLNVEQKQVAWFR